MRTCVQCAHRWFERMDRAMRGSPMNSLTRPMRGLSSQAGRRTENRRSYLAGGKTQRTRIGNKSIRLFAWSRKSGYSIRAWSISQQARFRTSQPWIESATTHYHPTPSGDGRQLLYGSKRNGVRQLFVMTRADLGEIQLTHLKIGFGAMWPHWQPAESAQSLSIP